MQRNEIVMDVDWKDISVAPDRTYHVLAGRALYGVRFDEVLSFHKPGLAAVRIGDEAWHITSSGQPAYPYRFTRTFGFYGGIAAVATQEGWHHVLPTGDPLYRERYAWCGNFQGERCAIRELSGKYCHLRPDGAPAYAARWRYAGDFREGIGVVQAEDGYSTHIDVDGNFVHGKWFLDLDVFHKGFARARDCSGWAHIDLRGRFIYEKRFAAIEPFYNGQARIERKDGGLEVIDQSGETLAELRQSLT